jgi:predicted nucleic acid-binding protein
VTHAEAVLDASVFLRGAVDEDDRARRWLAAVEEASLRAHVPELVYAEIANALARYVRLALLTAAQAREVIRTIGLLDVVRYRLAPLAETALVRAVASGISAYDACYLAIAEAADVVLVTADRRLAAVAPRSELLA